ncbi:MAG: phenylalanine--tRNA ligase subunit alpha [Patescibacteria group bacterium]|nr:phenylalanine--tRNA ligase subunit alpha [Patescibacteria group bacterium]
MQKQDIAHLAQEAKKSIQSAKTAAELEALRVRFIGRKDGEVTKLMKQLPALSVEDRRTVGPALNALKNEVEQLLTARVKDLADEADRRQAIDVTMPGKKVATGHLHPLTLVEREIRDVFKAMNFSVVEGPEVESEHYNFDALNIPANHPARDMWDTFWLATSDKRQATSKKNNMSHVADRLLLRTHTSPVQIRYMEQHQPPFQIVVPGRVFRYEATDASHEINFYQVEGLMVGKDVTLANFKFVIGEFFKRLFKKDVSIRLRPSYFPFVEPGLDVDVECVKCGGKGCNICKDSGWLEVMGAGMVHPHVFEAAGYGPHEYQGFAFGLGLERIAMIKYNIPDIRLFYSGDLRFIKQF